MASDLTAALLPLIDRRIRQKGTRLRGIVLTDPELVLNNSGGTTNTWMANVDVGGTKVIRRVLIKAASNGSRAYARRGQPVFLERNENGRWQIVAPADRGPSQAEVILVDQTQNNAQDAPVNEGLTTVAKPYSFFATINPDTGNTYYGEDDYANFRVLDGDGNEVL